MTCTANTHKNVDDLRQTHDDGWQYELTRGELVREPPPGAHHALIVANITQVLKDYADRKGGVVLAGDPGFILARHPDTVRAPDVAYVAVTRFRPLSEFGGWLHGPPDLAVEVLSPHDRARALQRKLGDYFDAGARAVWVADPTSRTLTAHDAGAAPVTLDSSMTLTAETLLPGFSIPVARLFRSPLD